MPSQDSNNATWYVLRYAEDFAPPAGTPTGPMVPFGVPSFPYTEPTLLFDALRGVLELQPEASAVAVQAPAGIAVDIGGDIYGSTTMAS